MYFHILCHDRPDHEHVRKANREAHLAYLEALGDRLLAAGPLLSDDGQSMRGSVLIIEFTDRAAAEEWARNDPYAKADLFASVAITPWRRVYPKTA